MILCVGSRDLKTNRWCSRTCCMHSMKLAQLVREHTDADVTVFYMDIRAPGKGYEEFYDKSLKEGIQFVRGRVAEVTDWAMAPEEEGKLVIRVEDTLAGFVRRIPVDMIVLAAGMEPQADAQAVRRLFNMSCGTEGWFLEKHPKLAPVSTFTDGVFIAGCCQGPKDIPDSVAQAGAAAAEAMALVDKGYIEQEPNTAYIIEADCSGCKSCLPLCPYTAITFDDAKKKARINEALCKGCGTCVAAVPERFHPAEPVRGRGDFQRNRRSAGLCLTRIGSPASWRSSATGAPTPPPTWPACRASSTPPTSASSG